MRPVVRNSLIVLSMCCLALAAQARDRSRIVNEGGIADEWTLVPGTFVAPGYPAEAKGSGDSVCLAIGYAIDAKGQPGDFILLKEWSDASGELPRNYYASYAGAAAGALSQWRFAPREGVTPRRTITVATMTFRGKQAIEVPALASNCKITDLATTLQEEGNKNAQNSDLRRSMEAQMRAAQQGKAMINPVQAISVQR